MYKTINWTFVKNFEQDFTDGSLLKKTGISEAWNARAYNAPFPLVNKCGLKIFHNDNPAEATEYTIGFAKAPVNQVIDSSGIKYGFSFSNRMVIIIAAGVLVNAYDTANDNGEFEIKYESGQMNYYVNGSLLFSTNTISIDDATSNYAIVAASLKNYKTDIQAVFNDDGIYNVQLDTILYEYTGDGTAGGVQTFTGNAILDGAHLPYGLHSFRFVNTDFEFFPESVVQNSISFKRIEDGKPVPFNIVVNQGNYVEIRPYVSLDDTYASVQPNSTYQILFSKPSRPILTETVWTKLYRNVSVYNHLSNGDFVAKCYNDILRRAPDVVGKAYHVNLLDTTAIDRYEMVILFKDSAEYQNAIFKEDQVEFDQFTFVFKTTLELNEINQTVFTEFVNDIYFKSQNMNALIDPDRIIKDVAELFNFQYPVTEYDAEAKEYNQTDTILRFNNSNTIEELFVKQYMPEYVNYFEDLNTLAVFETGNVKDLKTIILKNITLLNYFKGNKEQMEFLIMLFSTSIGYYLVSVDPDPYDNFVYRVSTSMPRRYWDNDIKHIAHPLGWNEFYVYIPSDATCPTQVTMWTDPQWAENRLVLAHQIPKTYLDYARFTVPEGTYRIHPGNYGYNAMWEDFTREVEFPFTPNGYNPNLDFQNERSFGDGTNWENRGGLYYVERSTYPILETDGSSLAYDENIISNWMDGTRNEETLIKHKIDFTTDIPTHTLSLLKSGLATYYIWEIFENDLPMQNRVTVLPELRFEQSDPNKTYKIKLVLGNCAGWRKSFYWFEVPAHTPMNLISFKSHIPASEFERRWFEITWDNWTNEYNGACIDNMSSHYFENWNAAAYDATDNALLVQTVIDLGFFTQYSASVVGNTKTYEISFDMYQLPYGLGGYQETVISGPFNLAKDLFTKFVWEYRSGNDSTGEVINIIETSTPLLNLQIHTAEVGDRSVTLKVFRCEDEYIVPINFELT